MLFTKFTHEIYSRNGVPSPKPPCGTRRVFHSASWALRTLFDILRKFVFFVMLSTVINKKKWCTFWTCAYSMDGEHNGTHTKKKCQTHRNNISFYHLSYNDEKFTFTWFAYRRAKRVLKLNKHLGFYHFLKNVFWKNWWKCLQYDWIQLNLNWIGEKNSMKIQKKQNWSQIRS